MILYLRFCTSNPVFLSHVRSSFVIANVSVPSNTLPSTEMHSVSSDSFSDSVRGWLRVGGTTAEFLEKYSEAGGTHHGIFVYGATLAEMRFFATLLGMTAITL